MQLETMPKVFNFNSIKVRLKQAYIIFFYFLNKFQFHKGTIKTNDS